MNAINHGTGWMPAMFKAEDVGNRPQEESEVDGQQDGFVGCYYLVGDKAQS
ncbi:hypothetical protein GCM10010096_03450 [Alcaligenes pakistanensis]|uniref:Uncharacterized protein n=1 Tax=Alcaligenes pakistanensis TaxID=1482717 RepID=A0A8H9M6B2_9BURK|nr:hypothetical protein [Alcaligenes pakistanensis]GHC37306.1 hypothetical protein GCM10010096_03450 [Alcaligenes pakistanensis]